MVRAQAAIMVCVLSLLARTASGQGIPEAEAEPVRAQPLPPPDPESDEKEDLPSRIGFQAAARVGAAFPGGTIESDAGSMSDTFGAQATTLVEVGYKPVRALFFGGYGGYGGFGAGGSTTLRYGIEALAFFNPGGVTDPWFGYGFGFESSNGEKGPVAITARGLEIARLMTGVDFRLSHAFGLGPFAECGFGEYRSLTAKRQNQPPQRTEIRGPAHFWLSLGARFVLFP